jgi:hypothetical protein
VTRDTPRRAKADARAAAAKTRRLVRIRERHVALLRKQQLRERVRMETRLAELDFLLDDV